jgi:outer membrane cobalamin receptor
VGASFLPVLLALAASSGERAVSQIEEIDLADLLEQDAEVTVSSSKSARLRDSPGVVTVMDRDEILQLGARDLAELLPYVAGFDLASDVFAVAGASFRGLWGYEGKVLILIDGIEVNETSYGSVPLFAHYSLDDVDRIEFLRGPGSARFGGFASLAVIHIHTRGGAARRGVEAIGTYGQASPDAPFRNQSVTVAGGGAVGPNDAVEVAVQAHAGTRTMSLQDYVDPHGVVVAMQDASEHRALQLLASATTSWARVRLLLDHYDAENQTGYIDAYPRAGRNSWQAAVLDIQIPLQPTSTFSVVPRLTLQRQLPWRPGAGDFDFEFRKINDRARLGVATNWQALPSLTVASGVELTGDNAQSPTAGPREEDAWRVDFVAGPEVQQFANGAAWGEMMLDAGLFLLTAGARGELHSVYGGSFVPRVALTRTFDGAHAKLMVAGAFRAPTIENLVSALGPLRPERTTVVEGEFGLRLVDSWYLTVNAFDIVMRDAILYVVEELADESIVDGYANLGSTGSRGVEATLLGAGNWGRVELAWSFATPAGKNEVARLAVPGDDDRLLAMPQHRLAVQATAFVARGVTATVHGVLRTARAATLGIDESGPVEVPIFGEVGPTAIVGATVRCANLLVPGTDLTLGIKNLLGDDDALVQTFAPAQNPVPYGDPEVFVRLAGSFGAR